MRTRTPVVAGQFYPATRDGCLEQIRQCLASRTLPEALPESMAGGIAPHAGWTFSGDLAALLFAALAKRRPPVRTIILFGTAHSYFNHMAAVDDSETWQTPLGATRVDEALREALLDRGAAVSDGTAHRYEHSIEVQLPFIQHLFPDAQIMPLIVPPVEGAVALGEACVDAATELNAAVAYIGSTDLTHYGPRYGFTPMGRGPEGQQWATNVNDRQFIDLALSLQAERLLSEAIEKGNACGPGAAAACMAAARKLAVQRGLLLGYATSNEVMQARMGATSRDSVGYAAILF